MDDTSSYGQHPAGKAKYVAIELIDAVDGEVVCKKEAFTTTLSAEELTFGGSTLLAVRQFEGAAFYFFFLSTLSLLLPISEKNEYKR